MAKVDLIERIIIFADGTGNAFSTQESNIWRLYQALDLTAPDQVALYIKGVGTSGFRPFAILDGATGIGVPSNVRKLYRYICWNWRPGVEIYLFGFSRGAFTVRTLIGLIASQGLVPDAFGTEPVSRAEMKRNAMAAWRAYRAHSIPRSEVLPTVTVARWLRDLILAVWHRVLRHRPYAEVMAERDRQGRRGIEIAFAGLFDTVEAYGVPINELRVAVDRAIWPISFRNFQLSRTVRRARHALSLDDERTTFHPVRFDMAGENVSATTPRIREVWFAGVHSDVGGGYPDGALSQVPLAWMMKEALATAPAPQAIRFRPGSVEAVQQQASPLAAVHDSRAGTAALYRYSPRRIEIHRLSGGPPIIHHSVAEKMVFGTENYAPLTLPHLARVLMPDGSLHKIHGFQVRPGQRPGQRATGAPPTARDRADEAVAGLSDPNADYVELTRDVIWWRRVGYFVLLGAVIAAAALPVTAPWLSRLIVAALIPVARGLGAPESAESWQHHLTDAQRGLGSNLNELSTTLGGLVPSYAQGWVKALVEQPLAAGLILLAALALYNGSTALRDQIADHARCAWFINRQSPRPVVVPRSYASRVARTLRTSLWIDGLARLVSGVVLPTLALIGLVLAGLVLANRAVLVYRAGSGGLCTTSAPEADLRHPKEGVANLAEGFSTDNPCWPTGLFVQKGRSYTIWIEMTEPYLDGRFISGVDGYSGGSFTSTLAVPFRRWLAGDWFQPVARIGASGNVEWLLQSSDGEARPVLAPVSLLPKRDWPDTCGKARPDAGDDVAGRQAKAGIRKRFISTFTAQGSGELFLFVNDALAAVPFGPTLTCFYENNAGKAKVTVELAPDPQIPPPQSYDFSEAP